MTASPILTATASPTGSTRIDAAREFLLAGVSGGKLTLTRILSGLLRAKVAAVFLGAAGVGLLAQGNQLYLLGVSLGSLAMAVGLVNKVAAEYRDPALDGRMPALETALTVHLVAASLFVLAGVAAPSAIGAAFWGSSAERDWVLVLLLGVPFGVMASSYLEAILFGTGRYDLYNRASMEAAVIGLLGFVLLVSLLSLRGAFWAVALTPVLLFLFFVKATRELDPPVPLFRLGFDWRVARELFGYGSTMLVTSSLSLLAAASLRGLLIERAGAGSNGIYQVPVALSAYYTPFLTSALWGRLQPSVTRSRALDEAFVELDAAWRWTVLAATAVLLALLVAPEIAVWTVYSREFAPAASLIPLQAIGDFLSLLGAVFGTFLLARGKLKSYLALSLVGQALFFLIGFSLVHELGARGILAAYMGSSVVMAAAGILWYVRQAGIRGSKDLLVLVASSLVAVVLQALVLLGSDWTTGRVLVPLLWAIFCFPTRERKILKQVLQGARATSAASGSSVPS